MVVNKKGLMIRIPFCLDQANIMLEISGSSKKTFSQSRTLSKSLVQR